MGTTILTFNTALSASFFFSKKNESQIYPCFLLHPLYLPILVLQRYVIQAESFPHYAVHWVKLQSTEAAPLSNQLRIIDLHVTLTSTSQQAFSINKAYKETIKACRRNLSNVQRGMRFSATQMVLVNVRILYLVQIWYLSFK